jgi:hypothetical protein
VRKWLAAKHPASQSTTSSKESQASWLRLRPQVLRAHAKKRFWIRRVDREEGDVVRSALMLMFVRRVDGCVFCIRRGGSIVYAAQVLEGARCTIAPGRRPLPAW